MIAGAAGRALSVIGESRAGPRPTHELGDGEAIRISTGAAVPAGATAVIPQEDVERNGELDRTTAAAAAGQNVREPGEDMRAGTMVLERGHPARAVELGAAVAAGVGAVHRRAPARASRCCAPATSCARPGEPLGPARSTTPTPRC